MSIHRSRKTLSLLTAFVLSLATLLPLSMPVMAQATTGVLTGTVTDPQGGAIPNAKVTVKNQETGVEQSITATGEGNYTFPTLPPGKYTVTVEAQGFKRSVITDVDVRIGTETRRDVATQAGALEETVTVTAGNAEEVVQPTSQISSSFETRKVEELPSNAAGGGIDTLALLAPGVVPGFGNVNSNGTTLSVNGNRARSNNFTLDGTDNNDLSIGGPNFFISNQDSVAEFQVITNNFSAQFGRNQGAIVNIVTKGGTNEFHGSGFEFHRNSSALDAETNAERQDPARSRRDKFISNVFGGTFGGPIVKNKAFFFVDGQLIRQRQQFTFKPNPNRVAITPAGLATLAAAFPGNPAIAVLVNQSLFALQPTATIQQGGATGNLCFPRDPTLACTGANAVLVPTGLPQYLLPLPLNQKEFGLRGDFNPTSKDNFNAKYRYQTSPETNTNSQSNGFVADIPFKSRNLNGAWTHQLGARSTNEFKAAWQKLAVIFGGCGTGTTDPLKGCIPTTADVGKAFSTITYTGIRASGVTLQGVGSNNNVPQGRNVRVFQLSDNFSHTMGRHSMIAGIDYHNLDFANTFLPNYNGAFLFGSTARIVANAPSQVTLVGGEPNITYKERDKFAFFQDDWKVRDNLTLNLGVRYEYTGQPINILNDITSARESNASTALWLQSVPLAQRIVPRIPVDKNNWAPRFGFAYSPRWGAKDGFSRFLLGENDATVIRGGYSIAYDPAFVNILLNVSTAAPAVFNNTIVNSCTNKPAAQCTTADILAFPLIRLPANPTGDVVRSAEGAFLQRNAFDPRFFSQTRVAPNFHSPYAQQWSLGWQRQVNRNNVFEVRYVGNHGIGLFQSINRNPFIGIPGSATNGGIISGFTSAGFGGTTFTFPSLISALPAGVTAQTCADDPSTPTVNEGICNGRLLPQGLLRSRENTGYSIHHSMQTRYNGRLFNQTTVGLAYTWSKTIDNASEIFTFGEGAFASNPFDLTKNERGLSGNDRRHAFAGNLIWDIPFFKKQEGLTGHVLGGWQINATYNLASGRPFTPSQFFNNAAGLPSYDDNLFQGTFVGLDAVRPFAGSRNAPRDAVGITDVDASYFGFTGTFTPSPTGFYSFNELNRTGNLIPVTTADVRFILNGPGAASRFHNPFGTVGRNSERGPALNQLNLGFFKNTKVMERVTVQFRAELFNALNHPNPGFGVAVQDTLPDTTIEDASNGGAGGSLNGFNDRRAMELSSRRVQFGIRIIF
jgi:outer membrane receptor protein involved in Fe transport